MRICFISFEYPPDTGIGGIATYVHQVAHLFAQKKIATEVICASFEQTTTLQENEFLTITKIKCRSTEEFIQLSPAMAAKRHQQFPFDIIEVPEYGAEGLYVKDKLPGIPLVVKLHTPKFLLKDLNDFYYDQSLIRRIKKSAGFGYALNKDSEYKAIQLADHILSPSLSLAGIVAQKWNIPGAKIVHAPNPYFPSPHLLDIPLNGPAKTILYMGRLETRKGMYNLSRAIPLVVKKIPDARFILLGKDSRGPRREKSMKAVMLKEMGAAASQVTFIDQVPAAGIPSFLSQAGTCVFPSLWENFPNVCLEAMSAGRGIVASREGGMKDMLEDIDGGVLIDPHDIGSIAGGIEELIQNKDYRMAAGRRAREKAARYYGDRLVDELLSLYRSFIR